MIYDVNFISILSILSPIFKAARKFLIMLAEGEKIDKEIII